MFLKIKNFYLIKKSFRVKNKFKGDTIVASVAPEFKLTNVCCRNWFNLKSDFYFLVQIRVSLFRNGTNISKFSAFAVINFSLKYYKNQSQFNW